jgi:hypothetical protein
MSAKKVISELSRRQVISALQLLLLVIAAFTFLKLLVLSNA